MSQLFSDTDVCIASVARTPIGSFNGKLKNFTAVQLASHAIKSALEKANVAPAKVEQVYLGNVLSAGIGQAPAKQAALGAGIPANCPCTTVNKVCASGMKAIMIGAMTIRCSEADVIVAAGTESMSNVPFYSKTARFGHKFGHVTLEDGLAYDGLEDAYVRQPMGNFGQLSATELGISREDQDRYAAASYQRAVEATKLKKFENEIVPIEIKNRKSTILMTEDEECNARPVSKASLSKLPPSFKHPRDDKAERTVTAGNASTLSDGAAAVVLVSGKFAKAHGVPVLAVIRGWGDYSNIPEQFCTAPGFAAEKALKHAGVRSTEVDFYEVNEAFSVVPLANMKYLGAKHEQTNIYGGAVSIGHPLGCSGTRIVCTLTSVLTNNDARYGVASICNGGGGASALVIERISAVKSKL